MKLPNDPLEALNWAWHHWDSTWWVIGAIGVAIAWTRKRLSDWSRNNGLAISRAKLAAVPEAARASAPALASAAYTPAPSYAGQGYTAQAAYAAPPAAPHPTSSRKLYREATAPPQRAATPAARSVDVPAPGTAARNDTGRWTLAGAFGDPAHARNAIIVAEVLGPPVALR